MPPCMMPDGGECCSQYHDLKQENAQLRNLLEAAREDNQRLRAELSEIRRQDSDLAERDEPLSAADKELLNRAWERHAAAKPVSQT